MLLTMAARGSNNIKIHLCIPRSQLLHNMLAPLNVSSLDLFLLAVGSWTLYKLSKAIRMRVKTTKLKGPPSPSWLFGVTKEVHEGDSGALYEKWAKDYGAVYQIPTVFGERRTILTDPKAIANFYSKDTFTYVNSEFVKQMIVKFVSSARA